VTDTNSPIRVDDMTKIYREPAGDERVVETLRFE
jgi:hypothetical protein